MHLLHRATWLLAAAAGAADPLVSGPSEIVQVDVVFPRPNETYAPAPILPLILGFPNPELTPYLHTAYVQVTIGDPRLEWEERQRTSRGYTFDLRWANFSRPDRQFEYRALTGFDTEGTWEMRWETVWATCDQWVVGSPGRNVLITAKGLSTTFTIKKGAPEQDLLSSISNCAAGSAVAFNMTETLYTYSDDKYFSVHDSRCPVLASAPVAPGPLPGSRRRGGGFQPGGRRDLSGLSLG